MVFQDESCFLTFVFSRSSRGHRDDFRSVKPCQVENIYVEQVLRWWRLVYPLGNFEWCIGIICEFLIRFSIRYLSFITCILFSMPMVVSNVHGQRWRSSNGRFYTHHAYIYIITLIKDILVCVCCTANTLIDTKNKPAKCKIPILIC
jgi:hypothetical protein